VFPSFYPELFQTRTRVTAMAISQNVGTTTALLPALFATVAPPGSSNIPLTVGAIAFGVTVIAAVAAFTARETYRVHLNDLGKKDAVPVAEGEYERERARAMADAKLARAKRLARQEVHAARSAARDRESHDRAIAAAELLRIRQRVAGLPQ